MTLEYEVFDLPARHLQQFWGASANFWQSLWDKFLSVVGDDPFILWIYGTAIYTIALYWVVGGLYTIVDVTNKPAFMKKFKVQPGTNEPVDPERLRKLIYQVLFNQFVIGFPVGFLVFRLMTYRGLADINELPTFHRGLLDFAVFILVEEFGFYYSHRILHHRSIYKHIHKKHHEWTAPIAITALYAHPVEHLVSNLFPILLGPYIMSSHIAVSWLWFTLAITNTLHVHSGYHLPFLSSPEGHDFHHLKFNQCFGVLGLLDYLHGTDTLFRASKAYERDFVLTSFVPVRELVPDEIKKDF